MEQHIDTSAGPVVFIDKRELHYSTYCQPRDIVIVRGPDTPYIKEEIAIDIRLGQGHTEVGVAKNLKFA
jgi:hypothetical protein